MYHNVFFTCPCSCSLYSGLCVGLGIDDDDEAAACNRLLLSLSRATFPPPSQACFLLPPPPQPLISDRGCEAVQEPLSDVVVDDDDSVEAVESAGEGTGEASADSDMADADEATELAGEKAATS